VKHAIIIDGLGRTGWYDSPEAAKAAARHIAGRDDYHGTWVTEGEAKPPKKRRAKKG
jgi:hypothetical protein